MKRGLAFVGRPLEGSPRGDWLVFTLLRSGTALQELVTRPDLGASCVPSSEGRLQPMHTPLTPTEAL